MRSGSSEVVLDPLDIVFSEIIACLYLDKAYLPGAPVGHTVAGPGGDIHGLTRVQGNLPAVNGGQGLSPQDIPMFGTAAVALEAQPLTGIDDNPFDFVIRGVGQNLIASPGSMIRFHKDPFYFGKK
jgi:hypothetical protein